MARRRPLPGLVELTALKAGPFGPETVPMRLPRLEPETSYLHHLRNQGEIELLARYLDDPNATRRLRRRVTHALASMAPGGGRAGLRGPVDPEVIAHLAPLLEGDPDPAVRRTAAFGLRRTHDRAAIGPLLKGLGDSDKAPRGNSMLGVGDLRAREAVEPLATLLGDRSYAVMAARALVRIGDERALESLRTAAASSRSRRRRAAFEQAAAELEARVGLRPSESVQWDS